MTTALFLSSFSIRSLASFSAARSIALHPAARRLFSDGPRSSPLSPESTAQVRAWMADFAEAKLDKGKAGCEVRYDRAGGPGGQNVNKVNSKATLRINLSQASPSWIPPQLIPSLQGSRYYAAPTNSLVIAGSVYRTQSENLEDCFEKLRAHLLGLAKPLAPAETSEAKKESIKEKIEESKAKTRAAKERDSARRKEKRASKRE